MCNGNKKIKLSDFAYKYRKMAEKKSQLKDKLDGVVAADPSSSKNGDASCLPKILQTDSVDFHERMDVVADEIIVDCKPAEVEQGFACYMEENVQADGWEAIWKSHQLNCHVLVEVTEVQADFQRAKVELVEPFCYESESGQSISKQDVEEVLQGTKEMVSLLELFPVADKDEDMSSTAAALEHLRFFYENIWRLSEENDCDDYYFCMRQLHPRMKMYYDVKNRAVSAAVADKYLETMAEYQQKVWQLKLHRAEYALDSEDEDEDEDGPEIPKAVMTKMTKLCKELDALIKTLAKLEDPRKRNTVVKGAAKKTTKKQKGPAKKKARWVFVKKYPSDF